MRKSLITLLILAIVGVVSAPAVAQPKTDDNPKVKPGKKDKEKKDDKNKKKGQSDEKKGKSEERGKSDNRGKSEEHRDSEAKKENGATNGEDRGTQNGGDKSKQTADENRKHMSRLAKIQRLAEIGSKKKDGKLVEKTKMLRDKENARHDRAMKRLESVVDAAPTTDAEAADEDN